MNQDASNFYERKYANFVNSGVVGLISKVIHNSIEIFGLRRIEQDGIRILEGGAGNGQHFSYVHEDFSNYVMTDIRPDKFSTEIAEVEFVRSSVYAQSLTFENESFDRLIATCLLAHIDKPEQAF